MSEGFLGRWSRRKQEVRMAEAAEDEKTLPATAPVVNRGSIADPAPPKPELPAQDPPESTSPLTLADVQDLGVDSDYKPFLTGDVAPEVKNAALRRLFSDPHFNVMDGLDTYVDDYSKSTPLPDSMLRQMVSAQFLKLFNEAPADAPPESPEPIAGADVAQFNDPGELPSPPVADAQPASQETDDHHADLRLQPDDATRAEDTRRGAG